jgi:hypothetical protein
LSVFTTEGTQKLIFKKTPEDCALERVAVLSDEIADRLRDNCKSWTESPSIPGRSRFRALYTRQGIAKPLRKAIKKLVKLHIMKNTVQKLGKGNWKVRKKLTGELLDNATGEILQMETRWPLTTDVSLAYDK